MLTHTAYEVKILNNKHILPLPFFFLFYIDFSLYPPPMQTVLATQIFCGNIAKLSEQCCPSLTLSLPCFFCGIPPATLSSGKVRAWRWRTCCSRSTDDWLCSPSSTPSDGSESLSEMVNFAAIVTSRE